MTTTSRANDTATEFSSAKDGIQNASKTIKEAQRSTRGTVKTDQRMTRLESTAARLTRELKRLGDRYNAVTDPELKESLAGKIVAINAKIIAFNDDVNEQLSRLREDVGQNTDDIAVEKGRNDGQDVEIGMLREGQQSLNQRIDTVVGPARVPAWQIVTAVIAGFIAGMIWHSTVFTQTMVLPDKQRIVVPLTAANSTWAAIGAGLAAAAIAMAILSLFKSSKRVAKFDELNEADTVPPATSTPAPQVQRTSIRATAATPNDGSTDSAPTAVLATDPGAVTGARS